MPKKVLVSKKSCRGPPKMKKTCFLKNGPSHNLPKVKYVICEPHEDLLQWNLSWAFTFIFLVHQEGGVELWVVVVMSEIAFFV